MNIKSQITLLKILALRKEQQKRHREPEPASYTFSFDPSALLDILAKNLNDLIYFVQRESDQILDGRIAFFNDLRIKEITGYSAKDFRNDPLLWEKIIHPDDIGRVIEHTLEIIANQKTGIRSYRIYNKIHGKYHWIEDKLIPQQNSNGDIIGFLGIARDITEQKRKEELYLHVANKISALTGDDFFRSFVQFFSESFGLYCTLILELEKNGKSPASKVIAAYLDQNLLEALDFSLQHSPAQLALQTGSVLYPQQVQRFFPDDRFLIGKSIESFIAVALKDDGDHNIGLVIGMDRRPMQDPDMVEQFLTIFSGRISAELMRKRAETALHSSERRLRAIFENTQSAIFLINDSGKLVDANPAAAQLTGYELFEIRKQYVSKYIPAVEQRFFRRGWKKFKQAGHAQGELNLITKTGETRLVEYKAMANIIPGLHLAILGDVTEKHQQDRAILEFTDKERMNVGREIHDGLGQYVTGIELLSKALAQKLEKKGLEEARNANEIHELIQKVAHQMSIIASGLPPVLLEDADIKKIFADYCRFIETTFEINCQFKHDDRLSIQNSLLTTQLFRIMQEAVHNAIKHGRANHITIELKRKNGNYLLQIVDNGIGIPTNLDQIMGTGMRSMIYRTRILKGTINFIKNTSGGTIVSCLFPPKGITH